MAAEPVTVASLIREASRRRGMGQAALAVRLGLSRQAIGSRETGRTPWTLSEVALLAQDLDLDLDAVLDAARDGGEVLSS